MTCWLMSTTPVQADEPLAPSSAVPLPVQPRIDTAGNSLRLTTPDQAERGVCEGVASLVWGGEEKLVLP